VYTLGEAAKATGKSKATISKAIKSGRISASKNDSGTFRIDPSELHRVYPLNVYTEQNETPVNTQHNLQETGDIKELRARLEAAYERLTDRDAVIEDLREDRDKWRQQATALLADQRPSRSPVELPSKESISPPPRRSWWPWRR
jgi:excisionase family DNA binding protein